MRGSSMGKAFAHSTQLVLHASLTYRIRHVINPVCLAATQVGRPIRTRYRLAGTIEFSGLSQDREPPRIAALASANVNNREPIE